MELVTFGETSLQLSPTADRFEDAASLQLETTGTESTVAVMARQLGTETRWVSKLPDSPLGRRVVADLRRHGVETEVIWGTQGRQGLVFTEQGRDPRPERSVSDRSGSAFEDITPGDLPMDRFQDAPVVFTSGSTAALSEAAAETVGAVLRAASGSGARTALALDYRPSLWGVETARRRLAESFDAVDVLFASERDVDRVLDRSGRPREVVHTLASDGDFEMVVLTSDEHGPVVWHNNVIHEHDTVDVDAVDDGGAYEAFVGGFLDRLLAGTDADEALDYGVTMAALARTVRSGVPTIERAEVERLVESA
jgi:2-dehydro-3-deoxygluconokinase